jgi:hypothetical protein
MKKGIVIYAHNNRSIDYALMAIISGGLAKKNLNLPVSLITDDSTVDWLKQSGKYDIACDVFEKILIVEKPKTNNQRFLHDGDAKITIPFVNTNRNSVWDLTPYDKTLLIDSDFLILSDNLNKFWDLDVDLAIGESINDIYNSKRLGYLDKYVSETGVKLYWATTVMFTKNENTKLFFDTVNYVKENYQYFGDVFRYDTRQYRNDIAFSIAKHLLDGFVETNIGRLPPVLSTLDRDILVSVDNNSLKFLINYRLDNNYCAASLSDVDVHIMNKQSIIRQSEKLLEMI